MIDLPIPPLTGSRRAFSRNVLHKELVGCVSKEALLEFALLEGLLLILAGVVRERDDEALFGKERGGDLGAGIHHRWTDEVALLHAIQQGVAEGRLAVLAAERAVRVQQQAALSLARIARRRSGALGSAGGG